ARRGLAVGVTANPDDSIAERAQGLERLGRLLAARHDVAADEDGRVVRDLSQHRFESTEVPVYVVEGRDAHQPTISSCRRRPAFGPPARTIVRRARAMRPCRPITLPTSPSATCSRKTR